MLLQLKNEEANTYKKRGFFNGEEKPKDSVTVHLHLDVFLKAVKRIIKLDVMDCAIVAYPNEGVTCAFQCGLRTKFYTAEHPQTF